MSGVGDLENALTSDMKMQRCMGVYTAGFWSSFHLVFLHYVPFFLFLNGNIFLIELYVGII